MSRQRGKTNKELLHTLEAHEHTLQMVAYEIHDGFTQHATAALLHLEAFRKNVLHDTDLVWKDFDAAVELLKVGIIGSRRLINELRLPLLEAFDLKTAIDSVISEIQSGDGTEVELAWQVRPDTLPPRLAHTVFRIVQECLTNARKHSKSHKVQVRFTQKEDWLCLEVEDWGVGFVTEQIRTDCIGLEGIRLRAKLLGGRTAVVSTLGQGTTVSAWLPIGHETQQTALPPRGVSVSTSP